MLTRIRKSAEGKDQGFTLVELLVVMIIVGILAAVAIPVFLNQREKAVDTSIKSDLRTAAVAIETKFVDEQKYTASALVPLTDVIAPGLKVSGENKLFYKATVDKFCVYGFSANGSAKSATAVFQYDSFTGGLKPGAPGAPVGTCA